MAWLNFSVMTIWSAMTPAGGMLPTWRRDDGKFVRYSGLWQPTARAIYR
jgi:hypothetical protein